MSAAAEPIVESPPVAAGEPYGLPPEPGPHPLTRRRTWAPLAALVFVLSIPFIHLALRGEAAVTTTVPFADDFQRAEIGENWWSGGGHWRIVDGVLYSPGVRNNPLWLKAKLPANVAVEFDVKATGDEGDVKAELFGNGRDHASGYVFVFGGWNNTVSIIARLDEHGRDRIESRAQKVERNRTYRMRFERRGGKLSWLVDGQPFMDRDDPQPLSGSGHDRLGFSTWNSDVWFDNLKIEPL